MPRNNLVQSITRELCGNDKTQEHKVLANEYYSDVAYRNVTPAVSPPNAMVGEAERILEQVRMILNQWQ